MLHAAKHLQVQREQIVTKLNKAQVSIYRILGDHIFVIIQKTVNA